VLIWYSRWVVGYLMIAWAALAFVGVRNLGGKEDLAKKQVGIGKSLTEMETKDMYSGTPV